ncbi:anti-sigma factor RsbA family regulatory protein [Streptomyces sp. NPDC002886]|uniref:anti-sigma factor RsbA family regulatory protein n=1 Tax=Streptomyces sp. NPDC002886 TaxID=3364667 RepID=UPI00369B6650
MTTTVPPASSGPAPAPFRHELYPYRGEQEFLSGTLGFIHEALEGGEAVVVAVPSAKTALLRGELAGEGAVTFIDTATAGPNPGRLVAAWATWMTERGEGNRPVRGIGETSWRQARNPAHLAELRYHEWLLNRAFARSTAWSMLCPYDDTDQDPEALAAISRCHPLIRRNDKNAPNEDYLAGEDYVFEALAGPRAPSFELRYTRGDLALIRSKVSRSASEAGVPEGGLAQLAVAVTEIATNSIRHGGGHGTLRTWTQNATFLCEFRDAGYISDVMAGRTRPSEGQIGGRGLWLAHQLCDLVEIRSTRDHGTIIRLHMDAEH